MPWKQAPENVSTPHARRNAGRLRRAMTASERRLWKHIRGGFAGAGTQFRRQVALGRFIVDCCFLGNRPIVEIDGAVHDTASARSRDRSREAALRAPACRVLRSNAEIALAMGSVLDRISSALSTSTPGPSLQRGGVLLDAAR